MKDPTVRAGLKIFHEGHTYFFASIEELHPAMVACDTISLALDSGVPVRPYTVLNRIGQPVENEIVMYLKAHNESLEKMILNNPQKFGWMLVSKMGGRL